MLCQAVALTNQEQLTASFPASTAFTTLGADIQLPDGKRLLNVSVYLDPAIYEPTMMASALAAFVGERFLAGMP